MKWVKWAVLFAQVLIATGALVLFGFLVVWSEGM